MEKLKRLIEIGDDEATLQYVKGDFCNKLDNYITAIKAAASLEGDVMRLQKAGLERQLELEQYKEKVDGIISRFESK